jgi:hypothetical protein
LGTFTGGGESTSTGGGGAPATGGVGSGGSQGSGGGQSGGDPGSGGSTADLGMPTTTDPGTGTPDLGSASPTDLGGVVCDNLQSTAGLSSPSGHHNAGRECQACHAPGAGAPTFYLAGTLYNAATGGAAVAGATINVTDANGATVKIVTATNGNFWTTTPLSFPVSVNASLCPNTQPMSETVGGNGACNNCHNATFQVHVP